LTAHAQTATHWAADKGAPWLLIVTHEALEAGVDAVALLDGCGLAPMLAMTGMIAQAVSPATRIPDGLQLDEPRDAEGCTALIDVNSAAYGMDLGASKPAYGVPAFWSGHVPVLGRVAGGAATSAVVLMAGGYRYVALVATNPAHQKRGFAEAAMRRALTIAEERYGRRPTFLHATDAGRPIYARMGYEPVSTHTCFIDKRLLTGH
jgi:GNAT superfamily N-acetyltransferase